MHVGIWTERGDKKVLMQQGPPQNFHRVSNQVEIERTTGTIKRATIKHQAKSGSIFSDRQEIDCSRTLPEGKISKSKIP
jgi:hypothetical protein